MLLYFKITVNKILKSVLYLESLDYFDETLRFHSIRKTKSFTISLDEEFCSEANIKQLHNMTT